MTEDWRQVADQELVRPHRRQVVSLLGADVVSSNLEQVNQLLLALGPADVALLGVRLDDEDFRRAFTLLLVESMPIEVMRALLWSSDEDHQLFR